jgi:DNA replication and repair protein RecF
LRIERIELTNFRNLRDVAVEVPPGGSFIIGRNAQGKTNLLESIYYLGTMKSFRTRREAELIRFGEGYFRCGAIARGERQLEVHDGRQLVKVNGARPRGNDAFGALCSDQPDDRSRERSRQREGGS